MTGGPDDRGGSQGISAIRTLAAKVERNGLVVLTFASANYMLVLQNWLIALNRLHVSNFLVVALDRETEAFLRSRDIDTVLLPDVTGLPVLWEKRMEVFLELTDAGLAVLHSDIDAVWLRDPIADFFHGHSRDVIASQGTMWPEDVHARWGFVLCCGLICFRPTTAVRTFLRTVREDVASTGDDQISLNRALLADGVSWKIDGSYRLTHPDTPVLCSYESIEGQGETLTVSVLPHHLFQRLPVDVHDAYVVHPLSPKDEEGKCRALKKAGLWFLRQDL